MQLILDTNILKNMSKPSDESIIDEPDYEVGTEEEEDTTMEQ